MRRLRSPTSLLGAARAELRSLCASSPRAYRIVERTRRHPGGALPYGPDCEVVIDGFQSSANSFVMAAFRAAQDRPTRVAGHLHAAGLVVVAARRGTPVLLLVRDPVQAAASAASRWPQLSSTQALRGWTRLYEGVLAVLPSVEVAFFEEYTTDLGAVIARLNRRFGTSFAPFRHTQDEVAAIYAPDPEAPERVVRRERKAEALERLADAGPRLERARALYERLGGG